MQLYLAIGPMNLSYAVGKNNFYLLIRLCKMFLPIRIRCHVSVIPFEWNCDATRTRSKKRKEKTAPVQFQYSEEQVGFEVPFVQHSSECEASYTG